MSLLEQLERHARERPGKGAVRGVSERGHVSELSWAELAAAVSERARHLSAGTPSQAVLLQSPTGVDLLIGLLAGLAAGRSVLPLPAAMPPAEVRALARRLDAGADRAGEAEGGSLLLCSSGTTGVPKIVRRRLPALDALGAACTERIGVGPDDTLLLPIPLHHSYGIDMAVCTATFAGCCVEIHERFQGALVLAALRERDITILPAVPMIFDGLARLGRQSSGEQPIGGRKGPVHRLRRAFSAGSPLPRRIYDGFEEVFGTRLGQIYGATEFGSLTFNDPERAGFDPVSVGHPLGDGEVRVVAVEEPDLDRPLEAGVAGQLAVRTSTLLSEYVDDPEPATRRGFFLPGDLGRLAPDGALTLTGRLKLLIDIGSVKVNPFEIEAVLGLHPGVKEVVVVGVAASDTVSRLRAVVVPEPGAEPTASELREFARERLIHYKVPRSFSIREDVPRSPTGKILRQELGRRAEPGRG